MTLLREPKPMKRLLMTVAISLALTAQQAAAQEEPEYRMEIGGGAGLQAYQGDYGGSPFKQLQPLGALVAKYKPTPRTAWAANLSFGKLKGSTDETETWYPDNTGVTPDFSTSTTTLDITFEYNFWAYGTGREYRGAKPLVPFITAGIGLAVAKCDDTVGAFEVPIGLGVKYKLANRLNLTVGWMMHITGSDRLDGVKDPYGIKSSGLFKNTDCYSALQVSVTYDVWEKCKTCHNDRD